MCGIAGYVGQGDETILKKMGISLKHRGPDAGGELVRGDVGLAHRRLAILDLSKEGAQPMWDKSGLLTIVFNGEIFNFQDLKKEYLTDVSFRSTSDTEVIIELFSKLGPDSFSLLQGMFSFALYDARTDELFLVRDSLGKKPLYYAETKEGLIFGSELKSLREHPSCPTKLDEVAIAQYLVFEYIPAPRTIYKGVSKLPPGSYLIHKNGSSKVHEFATNKNYSFAETGNFHTDLDNLLADSVSRRLVSDVPVGVFLSGGLDSSAVAYYAQQAHSEPIKTFSIGFTDPTFDEQASAQAVAKHFGTEHFSRTVGVEELEQVVEYLPIILDEPIADSSIVPTTLLAEFSREQVTVALSGDGADELFAGYDTFYAHELAHKLTFVPKPLIKMAQHIANQLPVSHSYMSFDFKLKRFLSGLSVPENHRNMTWLSAFTPSELQTILIPKINFEEVIRPLNEWRAYGDFHEKLEQEYKQGFLTEDILVKVDRATMHYGLEARSPFLDERVVQFANTLPYELKRQGKTGKKILREIMAPRLPEEVRQKKKQGFNIPIGRWFREEWGKRAESVLLEGSLVNSGLFNREALAILMAEHRNGVADHRKKLWTLYVLASWLERWHKNT